MIDVNFYEFFLVDKLEDNKTHTVRAERISLNNRCLICQNTCYAFNSPNAEVCGRHILQ